MLATITAKYRKLILFLLGFVDVTITLSALFLASYLTNIYTYHKVYFKAEFYVVSSIVLFTWVLLLRISHLSKVPRTSPQKVLFIDFIRLSFYGLVILFFADWLITFDHFPAFALGLFVVLNFLFLFSMRLITFKVFKTFRANGHNIRNIAIIANKQSIPIIEKVLNQKEWGFRILYLISDSKEVKERFGKTLKIHPRNANIKSLLRYDIIDELICFDCFNNPDRIYELVNYCAGLGITFRLHGKNAPFGEYKTRVEYIDKEVFTTFENNPINKFHHLSKTTIEICISFLILLAISPFLLFISTLIKLDSKGPVVFKQERVGLRGRKFYIYKFRSMVINAEELKDRLQKLNESDGPTFKIQNDPRITTLGRILRKTNLDELPQLFNVLKGEMSLIGPRPPIPSEVDQYKDWHLKRLAVKPGLTCTWQIVPDRNNVKFDDWVEMDIEYINNWSLKSDINLFFKTFKTVLFAQGV